MRSVRFLRNTDLKREGRAFLAGEVHTMNYASSARWVRRGAAEYVTEVVDVTTVLDEKPVFVEVLSGNTVESSADVGRADGGDTGAGAEHVAEPSEPRRRGRPPKHSDQ